MDEEILREFADQVDADPDEIVERWQGRPDLIIDDLFRIRDIDTGEVVDLELFDPQREFVHAYFYSDAGTINVYKGRRMGYSFIAVACYLLEGMFYPESFYPIVSRSLGQAKDRIEDLQNMIDHALIEIPTVKENTDYIELWNGTSFMAYSSDSDGSRGADSARSVLLDEMAFMEDEKSTLRVFEPFLVEGQNRKMVEVSTPNTKNDPFMKHNRQGSPEGEHGILSIKQPTFENAEEIDIHTSLLDQRSELARPGLNLQNLEKARLTDPEGFGQEFLCRPVVDEYRFFGEASIERAQDRGRAPDYQYGLSAQKEHGSQRVMGVDIGINRDDTVLSVMDHLRGERYQRALIVVDDDTLRQIGIRDPDRANANHIAELVNHVSVQMDVDRVIMDKGGVGQTFDRIIQEKIGRQFVGFDFSAKDDVAEMMGDMNIALRNDDVTLVPDDRLYDELSSIVKEKRDDYQRPKFSGKDHSESGKDDTAIATVLSAFPPSDSSTPPVTPRAKERTEPASAAVKQEKPDGGRSPAYGATDVSRPTRGRRNRYESQNARYR